MNWKKTALLALFVSLTFWSIDWLSHVFGGTETTYYYLSKLVNSFLFSLLLVKFAWKPLQQMKYRIIASIGMGLFISTYYFLSSYSGFVQQYGIVALTSPPTFFMHSPYLWGPAHMLYYFIALNLGVYLEKAVKEK